MSKKQQKMMKNGQKTVKNG